MKLTRQQTEDLLTLVHHARTDISFREGGSYNTEGKEKDDPDYVFDEKDAKAAQRAIDFIKQLIVQP